MCPVAGNRTWNPFGRSKEGKPFNQKKKEKDDDDKGESDFTVSDVTPTTTLQFRCNPVADVRPATTRAPLLLLARRQTQDALTAWLDGGARPSVPRVDGRASLH